MADGFGLQQLRLDDTVHHMSEHSGRIIIRNASVMGVATTAQKVLSFLYFAAIARLLGVEQTGVYFYAMSLSQILSVVLDGGFANYIVRETARDAVVGVRHMQDALGTKIVLIVVSALGIAIINIVGLLPIDGGLLAIAFMVVSVEALQVTLYSYLRGLQKISYEAVAVVCAQILTVVAGVVVLSTVRSVYLLLGVLVLASLFHLLYSYLLIHRFTRIWVRPRINALSTWAMLNECWPFALGAVFVKMISYTDTVVLGHFYSSKIVGYYSVPYKLTYSFQFIPLSLIATLYPAMSHLFHRQSKDLGNVLMESLRLLVIASAAIGFGIASIAPVLVPTIYGSEYAPAIAVAQVLPITLVILFAQYPIGALLNGSNHQRFQTGAMGLGMVVNVVANVLLVPPLGMMGAAVSSIIANCIFLALSAYKAHQVVGLPLSRMASLFARSILAGGIMFAVVSMVLRALPLPIVVIVGACVFIGGCALVGLFTRADITRLQHAFGNHVV